MIDRRSLFLGIAAASAIPASATAQIRMAVVGMLLTARPDSTGTNIWPERFRRELARLGWNEGENLTLIMRFANDDLGRLPDLAAELVALGPDVILTHTTTGASAAAAATPTIPIVVGAAVEGPFLEIVGSLARPKGNVTGFTAASIEQHAKVIELLREINPAVKRIAVLVNPFSVAYTDLSEIAAAPGLADATVHRVEVKDLDTLATAFEFIRRSGMDAVVVTADPTFNRPAMDRGVAQLARSAGIAAAGTFEGLTQEGGLITYGVDYGSLIMQSAGYVDKILRGAKPRDLPVERPTLFKLTVNAKTATELGLTIPPSILVRADQIIE